MNKIIKFISIFAILLIPTIASAKEVKVLSWDENARKAEYMYLESLRLKSLGETDAFYELLKQAHELDPSNTIVSYYLGYCDLMIDSKNKEKVEASVALMNSHIEANPADYYEGFIFADICNKLGRNADALKVWEKLSDLYPDKIEVKYNLADGYALAGDYKKGIAEYNEIEKRDGKSIQITVRKINFYLSLNDTVSAISEGKILLESAPKSGRYNLLMGDIYQQLNYPDSALVYYNKAQEYEPENGMVYLSKASYFKSLGDSTNYEKQIYQALINENLNVDNKLGVLSDYIRQQQDDEDSTAMVDTLFNVLISQHPHEAQIHRMYSSYLAAHQDYRKASEQLSYVLDILPTSAEDWKKLMFVNLLGKDYKKAIDAAQKSLEYNPDNIELYQYIAPCYMEMKEYNKAIEIYNVSLEKIDSTDLQLRSNIYGGIADVYNLLNDSIKVFENCEKALDLYPGNPGVLNNYAYYLSEKNKDLDKAEKMAALAVKSAPNNSTYIDTYAWVFFKKREYKLAKMYIESAIEKMEGENADLYEHYGDILFMSGEPENAVAQWEKALKIKPDSELLQRKVKFKTYFYK